MTDKNLLYAHVLLDRSGSMSVVRARTVEAVNGYVQGLKADDALDAAVSLTLFDSPGIASEVIDLSEIIDGKLVGEVAPLTLADYVPRGSTPLNDAIGRTITRMRGQYHRPNERIALVIVTDGQENASKEYTRASVKALLDDVQREGWLVIYLGANQDAFAEGAQYGAVAGNTLNFSTSNIGSAMSASLRATRSYASGAGTSKTAFTDEERESAR